MVAHRVGLRRREALAFHGANVEELRALQFFHVLQGLDQAGQVVAVQWADIVKAEFLEHGAGGHHAFHVLLGALGQLPGGADFLQHFLGALAHGDVGFAGPHLGEIGGEPAAIVADRHLVVVEYHQHVGTLMAGVGQGLEGHAPGDRTVADHRHDLALNALVAGGQRHTHRG